MLKNAKECFGAKMFYKSNEMQMTLKILSKNYRQMDVQKYVDLLEHCLQTKGKPRKKRTASFLRFQIFYASQNEHFDQTKDMLIKKVVVNLE